jgi:hypothetical protein
MKPRTRDAVLGGTLGVGVAMLGELPLFETALSVLALGVAALWLGWIIDIFDGWWTKRRDRG